MSGFRKAFRPRAAHQVVHFVELPRPLRGRGAGTAPERTQRETLTARAPRGVEAMPLVRERAPLHVGPSSADLARLEEELLARTAARLRAAAPGESADKRRVEQLERRLRKLSGLLDERDRVLRSILAQSKEDGLASVYDSVQGLDQGDAHYEAKKEMMASIFHANLSLRDQIGSPEA